MKKVFLFIFLIFMIGCEDYKKLDYDIERLENKFVETKSELEAIKSMVDKRLSEGNQILDETQVLIDQNDAFQADLEELENQSNDNYLIYNYIIFLNHQANLFSEYRNILGELLSYQGDVYEIALVIYWDKAKNRPIPIGDIWLVEDMNDIALKRTGEVLKLHVTSETEFSVGGHGEIVNKEEFEGEIDEHTILYLEIVNETIMSIYDSYNGPVISLDRLY